MWKNKQLIVSTDVYRTLSYIMKVSGDRNCSFDNILQNIFFCVQQKKESHTGLEEHESE